MYPSRYTCLRFHVKLAIRNVFDLSLILISFNLQKGSGLWPATYTLIPATEGKEKCLDPNHTHFLLVDNGTTNQTWVEMKFRDELERQIANTKTGNSQGSLNEK